MENNDRIKEKVIDYILDNQLIKEGDTVSIGVSGGADSVCLLFLLTEIQKEISFTLRVIHVEHGIRGDSSLEDASFVADLCKRLKIDCRIENIRAAEYSAENGLSLEEAARILRYAIFDKEAQRSGGKIAVAHHMEDQAETVLFQMIRGSGLRGMGGMNPERDNIIRPLLCLTKTEILDYLRQNQISYRVDETNSDITYSRNRIRKDIIPVLKEMQPESVKHIFSMAEDAREADEYIEKCASKVFDRTAIIDGENIWLDLNGWDQTEEILQKAVIRQIMALLIPQAKDVGRAHVMDVQDIASGNCGRQVDLPKGIRVIREKDSLLFTKASDETRHIKEKALVINGVTDIDDGGIIKTRVFDYNESMVIPRNTYTKWFDYDRMKFGLQVRGRCSGDYFYVDDKLHKQKLKDYFINEKIPKTKRDEMLLIADDDHVVWLVGQRISEAYKVSNKTKKVLEIQISGGNYGRED